MRRPLPPRNTSSLALAGTVLAWSAAAAPSAAETAAPREDQGPAVAAAPAAPATPAVGRDAGDLSSAFGAELPSLSRILRMVQERGPTTQVGRASIAAARSGYVGARLGALTNPYMELTGERSFATRGGTGMNAAFWIPFEVFGQRSSRIEETDAAVKLTETSVKRAQSFAAGEAVRAYGMVVVGVERVKLLTDLIEVADVETRSYEARYAAGDATLQDARLARVDLARYGVQREEARADVAVGLGELARLTGSSFTDPPSGSVELPPDVGLPASLDALPAVSTPRAEARYHARVKERLAREALGPLMLMLNAGRNDVGDPRVGAGVAYTFPVLRRSQGEQARADAEQARALVEANATRRIVEARLRALVAERAQVRRAIEVLTREAEPAAAAAVDAATEMRRSGKGDVLIVLTSRRDLALLRLRHLELIGRDWTIASELVSITGTSR